MAAIDSFVEVFITKNTQQIDITSFSIPMILSAHDQFPERARVYNSLTGVAEDFPTTSVTYIMAQKLFSQELVFPQIVIGRKDVDHDTVTVIAEDATVYSLTIDGETYSYTSGPADTETTILTALRDLLAEDGVVAVLNADGDELAVYSEAVVTGNSDVAVVSTAATESYSDALFAVQEENDDFYAVVIDSHDPDEVLAFAQTIEAMTKIFGTSTSDRQVLSAISTTDIASQLYDLNLERTFTIWSATADTEFPEAAWLHQLLEVPGSNTWALKSLSGVTVSRLSETEVNVLGAKRVNYFRRVKGAAIIMNGQMASKEFIDNVVFLDWWKARVQEAVFFRMINSRKIPYTQQGATLIEAEIRNINAQGIANGGIADTPAPTVQSPNVLAIPEAIRATRVMGDFVVNFRLAGAVHKVSAIRATVSV